MTIHILKKKKTNIYIYIQVHKDTAIWKPWLPGVFKNKSIISTDAFFVFNLEANNEIYLYSYIIFLWKRFRFWREGASQINHIPAIKALHCCTESYKFSLCWCVWGDFWFNLRFFGESSVKTHFIRSPTNDQKRPTSFLQMCWNLQFTIWGCFIIIHYFFYIYFGSIFTVTCLLHYNKHSFPFVNYYKNIMFGQYRTEKLP